MNPKQKKTYAQPGKTVTKTKNIPGSDGSDPGKVCGTDSCGQTALGTVGNGKKDEVFEKKKGRCGEKVQTVI